MKQTLKEWTIKQKKTNWNINEFAGSDSQNGEA
jgi:hypothetical protein